MKKIEPPPGYPPEEGRYLVLAGPESPGHFTGEALIALFKNGIDQKKTDDRSQISRSLSF